MSTGRASPTTRALRDRDLPARVEKYNPYFLHGIARLVFLVCLVSLPLDLLLASLELEMEEQTRTRCDLVMGAMALLSVLSIRKEPILDFGLSLLEARQRMLDRLGNRASWLFIGFIALIALAEAFARASHSVASLALWLLFALGAIISAWQSTKEKEEQEASMRGDPILWLDNANLGIASFSILPIVTARAISLVAAFDAGHRSVLPYWSVSLLLVLALAPQREDFLITCRRCAGWTSRALKNRGYCQFCAREMFQPIMPAPAAEHTTAKPPPPSSGGGMG